MKLSYPVIEKVNKLNYKECCVKYSNEFPALHVFLYPLKIIHNS